MHSLNVFSFQMPFLVCQHRGWKDCTCSSAEKQRGKHPHGQISEQGLNSPTWGHRIYWGFGFKGVCINAHYWASAKSVTLYSETSYQSFQNKCYFMAQPKGFGHVVHNDRRSDGLEPKQYKVIMCIKAQRCSGNFKVKWEFKYSL